MVKPSLFQLHLTCLRQSCFALSTITQRLLSDPATAQRLLEISSQLPGPALEEPAGKDRVWTAHECLQVSSSVRASLDLLSSSEHLSELGKRTSDGLRVALDTVEEALGQRLRQSVRDRLYGLYVIIDPQVTAGRDPLDIARQALQGGTRTLQLRDKLREKGESLALARAIKGLCEENGVLFIANDHADLAAAVAADGVHLGQGDLPVQEVRQMLQPHQIIGRSNHLVEEALESRRQGADYVAVGSIYSTATKKNPKIGGLEPLSRVKERVDVPVVAIGGILLERVQEVVKAGADAICVTGAVGLAPNPQETAQRLVEEIRRAGGKA